MPGPLIVGAEGVILTPDKAYASSRPINEGLELIMMLDKFPTSSLTFVCNTDQETEATYFVKMNGFPKARVLLTPREERDEYPEAAQWNAINRERAKGPINLVVTSYREVYDNCCRTRQAALLFGRKGALSTLGEQPSWRELSERVKANKEARLEDDEVDQEGF